MEKITEDTTYSSSNLQKYLSKNVLKQICLNNFKQHLKSIFGQLKLSSDASILDMGCGEGIITNLFAKILPDNQITGIDISKEALAIAAKITKNVELICGNIYDNHLENNQYDLVICSEVLEHLEDTDAAIKELMRVSNKYILITVPEEPYFSLGNFISLKNVRRLGNPEDHLHLWTKRAFKNLLKQELMNSDFKIITTKRIFPWQLWILEKTK